jgi:hypothetical protein
MEALVEFGILDLWVAFEYLREVLGKLNDWPKRKLRELLAKSVCKGRRVYANASSAFGSKGFRRLLLK